jgi:hypothetical protein
MPEQTAQDIDLSFTAEITADGNSGWACVVVPSSGEYFGTKKAVKVGGTVDGHPFQATMLPIGGGNHMLPLRAALRKAVGKDKGEKVAVKLDQRFS